MCTQRVDYAAGDDAIFEVKGVPLEATILLTKPDGSIVLRYQKEVTITAEEAAEKLFRTKEEYDDRMSWRNNERVEHLLKKTTIERLMELQFQRVYEGEDYLSAENYSMGFF